MNLPWSYDSRFVRELPGDPVRGPGTRSVEGALWSSVDPEPVRGPRLVASSAECGALLDLGPDELVSDTFVEVIAGNRIEPGMRPIATAYGGHQFGSWAGQLGDGRATLIAEVLNRAGQRYEVQLKGAGPTPYSRRADGRAVLRSSIREFLCSEAMFHLGVPTTRALAIVRTGEGVVRDLFYDGHPRVEPGAIVCRVAPSFIRFGHFELPSSRGDRALLGKLLDFTIRRDFPHLVPGAEAELSDTVRAAFFHEVCLRTATVVAGWMRYGFVHGVLNTDNMSVLGLTIDYGPYGWIEEYDPSWTPNTTDAHGRRYALGNQPAVAQWNLARLAGALFPVLGDEEALREGLRLYVRTFLAAERRTIADQLGLTETRDEDVERMEILRGLLHGGRIDYGGWFRSLAEVEGENLGPMAPWFYDEGAKAKVEPSLRAWLGGLSRRVAEDGGDPEDRRARMRAANPKFLCRNYLCQEVIERAESGDDSGVGELLDVLRRPFDEQPGRERFAGRRPEWARNKAGCSMLSCSS